MKRLAGSFGHISWPLLPDSIWLIDQLNKTLFDRYRRGTHTHTCTTRAWNELVLLEPRFFQWLALYLHLCEYMYIYMCVCGRIHIFRWGLESASICWSSQHLSNPNILSPVSHCKGWIARECEGRRGSEYYSRPRGHQSRVFSLRYCGARKQKDLDTLIYYHLLYLFLTPYSTSNF